MSTPEFVETHQQSYNYYNRLPSLEEADILFNDRREVFQELINQNVYAKHDKFVVHLIHRHFTLRPGEILVTRKDMTHPWKEVTQPEKFDEVSQDVFPSAWLANGLPIEFSVGTPPPNLSSDLQKLLQPLRNLSDIPHFGGMVILGLRYVPEGYKKGMIDLEVTHFERRSITTRVPVDEVGVGIIITTCWYLAFGGECETCKCKQEIAPHLKVCTP